MTDVALLEATLRIAQDACESQTAVWEWRFEGPGVLLRLATYQKAETARAAIIEGGFYAEHVAGLTPVIRVRRAAPLAHPFATPATRDPHVAELEAAIDRVRRLHTQDTSLLEPGVWCPGCGYPTPCPTIRALNG